MDSQNITTPIASIQNHQNSQLLNLKQKPTIRLIIIIFFLFLTLSMISNYNLFEKNQKLESQLASRNKFLLKLTPGPTSRPKNALVDLRKELDKIFTGNVNYKRTYGGYINTSNSKLEYYSSDNFEMRNMDRVYYVLVEVYKYVPGLKYENAYEGSRWSVDMDKWFNFLYNVKEGKHTGFVYDNFWGELSQYEKEFNVVMLGNRKFVISNSNFQPAESWDHEYQTYDIKNKQFVIITLTFLGVGKNDDLSCLSDVKEIFYRVENNISQIN